MKLALLFISLPVFAAPADTHLCSYWIEKLGQIAELERSRVEVVPRIQETDGYYAATDYDIDLRARILAIMKRIEKETR